MEALYSSEALAEAEAAILDADVPSNTSQSSLPAAGRMSRDDAESMLSHSGGDLSPVTSAQSNGRKGSLFRKLGWKKP